MNVPTGSDQPNHERMSNTSFKLMSGLFTLIDHISPYVEKRALSFDIQPGMTVIDYGCGPGRYTRFFSKMVGQDGLVYAVDIHELAVQKVTEMAARNGLKNVRPVLAHGYHTGLPDAIADRIFALDMFHGISQPSAFLAELSRLIKPDGCLIIEDGHQPREEARRKIQESGLWKIESETKEHLVCRPGSSTPEGDT